jgi:hypothetical protein
MRIFFSGGHLEKIEYLSHCNLRCIACKLGLIPYNFRISVYEKTNKMKCRVNDVLTTL